MILLVVLKDLCCILYHFNYRHTNARPGVTPINRIDLTPGPQSYDPLLDDKKKLGPTFSYFYIKISYLQ